MPTWTKPILRVDKSGHQNNFRRGKTNWQLQGYTKIRKMHL